MASDITPAPPSSTVRREAPFWSGILLGAGFLLHPCLPRFVQPIGADWDTYLTNAAHLWIDPEAFPYLAWRPPLYPLLVGGLGEVLGSYVLAGEILSLVAAVLTVGAAACLARTLAGSWAGGLAAVATAGMPLVVDGSFQVGPYLLLGAAAGVALAAGAACARRPRWGAAILVGLGGGFAWALDGRGMAAALGGLLLVLLGPARARRKAGLVALAACGIVLFLAVDQGARAHWDLQIVPLAAQVDMKRWQVTGPGAPKAAGTLDDLPACREQARRLGPAALLDDCARSRRAQNLAILDKGRALPPLGLLLAVVALALLPGRRGLRGSAASAVVFLPPLALTALAISWVPFAERYLLPWAACLGAVGSVALLRLGATVAPGGRMGAVVRVASGALAAAWALLAWPGLRPWHAWDPADHLEAREVPRAGDVREVLARWAEASLRPDDLLMDCGSLGIVSRLLPTSLPLREAPPHSDTCRRALDWPAAPGGGDLWLLTRHLPPEEGARDPPDPETIRGLGWEEVPVATDLPEGSWPWTLAQQVRRWRRGRPAGP